jgi:hypothetical protein
MGVAAILPDGFDERQVLVGLVATAPNRPLHEHNHILQHYMSEIVDVSPLYSRSKVRTYPQLAQVRGSRKVLRRKLAPKSGPKRFGEEASVSSTDGLPRRMTGVPDVESRSPLVMAAIHASVSEPIAANQARVSCAVLAVRTQVRAPISWPVQDGEVMLADDRLSATS